ncbi:MAG: extracellular solute-binding protein [Clostridia bacterium]|nr:extracellular solute-binding protein [Clostridia bacterium]
MKKSCYLRFISLFLVIGMLGSALLACADDTQSEQSPDPSDSSLTPSTDTTQEEQGEQQILPDVEAMDYDYTLNVLHWTVDGNHEFYNLWNEICPDENTNGITGDIIADDIYDRTGWINENYGITLTCQYQSHMTIPTVVANLIKSGSDEYQVMVEFGFNAQRTMGRNYYTDLTTLANVDPSKPWWVKESFEELAIGEFVEFAASDLLILDKGATSTLFYNIPMADDLGLDNLYELVEDGLWTFEEMIACAENAYADNGNDTRDGGDVYGFAGSGDIPVLTLYIGSGMKLLDRDEDGEYYYQYGSDEQSLEIMTTILEDLMYQDFYWNDTLENSDTHPSFPNGGALFNLATARACSIYRNMEDAYGILPVPKYDEYQDKYYSQVNTYHDSMLAVFNTVESPEKVGAALELLSYYSYYNIYPDFYDVVIQGRGTRDEESRRMLDLIFSNRSYDLGLVYDPLGFSDTVLRYTATGSSNLTSFIESWEDRLSNAAKTLNELAQSY